MPIDDRAKTIAADPILVARLDAASTAADVKRVLSEAGISTRPVRDGVEQARVLSTVRMSIPHCESLASEHAKLLSASAVIAPSE